MPDPAPNPSSSASDQTPPPKPRLPLPTPGLILTLCLGAVGGWIFHLLNMPLAWMMGSLAAVMIAALSGVAVERPIKLRLVLVPVLGVMLGSAFSPDILDGLTRWVWSALSMALYAGVVTAIMFHILTRYCHYDPKTAFLSSAPGGVNDLIQLASQYGADERVVSLMHATRIAVAVFVVPIWFRLAYGDPSAETANAADSAASGIGQGFTSWGSLGLYDAGLLSLCAIGGYWLATLIRLPAGAILGPMLASAAVHLAGWTEAAPPTHLVWACQIVLGCAISSRFAGVSLRKLAREMLIAALSGLFMIVLAVPIALILGELLLLPSEEILLAFSPGGLMEMGLIALSAGLDPAFVSAHHLVRITLVILIAPIVFRALLVRPNKTNGS